MKKYVALCELCLPTPGRTPSSQRIKAGTIFALEGDEGINIEQLLRQQAIKEFAEEVKADGKDTR